MKKIVYALILGILITATACQKDVELVQSNANGTPTSSKKSNLAAANNLAYGKQGDCTTNGIYVENGMLVFSDVYQFQSTLECLEQQVQDHNQAFQDQYGYLGDEGVTSMLEQTNFNEFLPLENFEKGFGGYQSLRQVIEAQMPAWLKTPDLDINTYPRKNVVGGQGLRTLVSSDYKVKVGGDIMDFSLTANISNNSNSSSAVASSCGMMGFSAKSQFFDNNQRR